MLPNVRVVAARRSLEGLSVGDAFGECFFSLATVEELFARQIATRTLPNWRWRWTDDTAMALSIFESLAQHGTIECDALADAFARRYALDDRRGYGGTAHGILMAIGGGARWQTVAPAALGGSGSMGNGGAMRVAPLGAYFSDDPERIVEEARRSAQVTHSHPEGQAGAIATALAAGYFATARAFPLDTSWNDYFEHLLRYTPDSNTRARIAQAAELPPAYAVETAASVLGNGLHLTAPDTVPFCVWSAARATEFSESHVGHGVSHRRHGHELRDRWWHHRRAPGRRA